MIKIFENVNDGGEFPIRGNSFSGNERNRLFIQRDGNFEDQTLVSGADFIEDGRSVCFLDYDKDGFLDMALSGPQSPQFRILRNEDGSQEPNDGPTFFRLKLEGGFGDDATSPNTPTDETLGPKLQTEGRWSNRDGIGAKVKVYSGDNVRLFEHICGTGLAAQNSSLIHIGTGKQPVDRVEVIWPSGKRSTIENIRLGETIVVKERENSSTD